MAECGQMWSEPEIAALLTKWAKAGIQHQLLGAVRNIHPYSVQRSENQTLLRLRSCETKEMHFSCYLCYLACAPMFCAPPVQPHHHENNENSERPDFQRHLVTYIMCSFPLVIIAAMWTETDWNWVEPGFVVPGSTRLHVHVKRVQ